MSSTCCSFDLSKELEKLMELLKNELKRTTASQRSEATTVANSDDCLSPDQAGDHRFYHVGLLSGYQLIEKQLEVLKFLVEQEQSPFYDGMTHLFRQAELKVDFENSYVCQLERIVKELADSPDEGQALLHKAMAEVYDGPIEFTGESVANWNFQLDFTQLFDNIERKLGEGGFATVYLSKLGDKYVAIKELKWEQKLSNHEESTLVQKFKDEVELLARIPYHQHLLRFYGATTKPPHLSIVMEYAPKGSIRQLLDNQNRKIDWKQRIKWALQTAQALDFLHGCKPVLIHRDIKADNVLLTQDLNVKLCDFGLSKEKTATHSDIRMQKLYAHCQRPFAPIKKSTNIRQENPVFMAKPLVSSDQQIASSSSSSSSPPQSCVDDMQSMDDQHIVVDTQQNSTTTNPRTIQKIAFQTNADECGSPAFVAPEIIKHRAWDTSVDVYAFGMFLWELLTRQTPYANLSVNKILQKCLSNERPKIPKCPKLYRSLIKSCWHHSPHSRPYFSEIVSILRLLLRTTSDFQPRH